MLRCIAVVVLCLAAAGGPTASAAESFRWQRSLGLGEATAVTADGARTLYVGTTNNRPPKRRYIDTARIDLATRRVRWKARGWGDVTAMVVTPDGDPVVAGASYPAGGHGPSFGVVRRDRRSGRIVWRYDLDGTAREPHASDAPPSSEDRARGVAVLRSGDLVASGYVENAGTGFEMCVVRLAVASGRETWRRCWPVGNPNLVLPAHVEANGDIVVSVGVRIATDRSEHRVMRLDAQEGFERWRRTGLAEVHSTPVSAPGGLLVLVGAPFVDGAYRPTAVALLADSGETAWTWLGPPGVQLGNATVLPSGDVVLVGTGEPEAAKRPMFVASLHAADGAVRWERRIADTPYISSTRPNVAIGGDGAPWATFGWQYHRVGGSHTIRLDPATGSVTRSLESSSCRIADVRSVDAVLVFGSSRRHAFVGALR